MTKGVDISLDFISHSVYLYSPKKMAQIAINLVENIGMRPVPINRHRIISYFLKPFFWLVMWLWGLKVYNSVVTYKFPNAIYSKCEGGVSAIILLLESHLSIHTWPEYNYFHVTISSCGEEPKLNKILESLEELEPILLEYKVAKWENNNFEEKQRWMETQFRL